MVHFGRTKPWTIYPERSVLKCNFHINVNGRFWTSCVVTLYLNLYLGGVHLLLTTFTASTRRMGSLVSYLHLLHFKLWMKRHCTSFFSALQFSIH